MSEAALLGVDVGFSERRRSTGLAWRIDGKVSASLAGSTWESRASVLPTDALFDLAALDAPLMWPVPSLRVRSCEAAFYRGVFGRRCRPGMSHFGSGLKLREAGSATAAQFIRVLRPVKASEHRIVPGTELVEAFPSAFLGVLLPEATYSGATVKRGGRSDWLYEAARDQGCLDQLLDRLGWSDNHARERFRTERDHDLRAALVCLLTAGFASAGTATLVGDESGWFWLPPIDLWAPWAVSALEANVTKARLRGHADLRVVRQGFDTSGGHVALQQALPG